MPIQSRRRADRVACFFPDSNYDSPYRTGQHVPLNPESGPLSGLASVATASESRQDVSSASYFDGSGGPVDRAANSTPRPGGSDSPRLPAQPYSPGSRSETLRRQNQMGDGFEMQSPSGEIQMQSFQDGLPPAPPVSHSWHRIDKWAEENYPELYDQLCEGATNNDLNELEHILDRSLPNDVRDSLQIHDGQERGGIPTGIVFGCMLLDCEEIVQEWDNWRRVNSEFLQQSAAAAARSASLARSMAGPASNGGTPGPSGSGSARSSIDGNGEASSSRSAPSVTSNGNPMWRQELLARQDSVPPGAVQKAYVHHAWIPLVRDWGGNNLAVDLAPGPRGQWGQVIMFGRDYDTKYVVARSWSAFLALVADDLGSGKWFIDEDNNELKLREFKTTRVEPPYLDILRWRMDQKYGRRNNKRKSAVPGTNGSPTNTGSPYASPTDAKPGDRGRQLQRLSASSPLASPSRTGYNANKLGPLARVTEETSLPELNMVLTNGDEADMLMEVSSSRANSAQPPPLTMPPRPPPAAAAAVPPFRPSGSTVSAASTKVDSAAASVNDENAPLARSTTATGKAVTIESEMEDGMKTIEI